MHESGQDGSRANRPARASNTAKCSPTALTNGTHYSTSRNPIEGFNALVKGENYESPQIPEGDACADSQPQYLLTTVLTAAANIRKITSYLTDHHRAAAGEHVPPKRRRPAIRTTSIQQWGATNEELQAVGANGPPI